MTITNTWNVTQMDAYPEYDGEADVVFTVHWTLIGTDGTYVGSVYGSTGVSLDEEFTNLIRFQRGFQAAAQLINVSNVLLDDLIGLIR